jgi:hypothetical protein
MLTEVDIKRLPSYSIGYEDGEARGEAQMVRRLLARLDTAQVAELLGLSREQVVAIAAAGDRADTDSASPGG